MIKVIFVENNEIKMSKEEFERLLEETYRRGKEENYKAAYNEGYKDGYCHNHWYGGISCTTLNATGTDNTITNPNPWLDRTVYCDSVNISNSCRGE